MPALLGSGIGRGEAGPSPAPGAFSCKRGTPRHSLNLLAPGRALGTHWFTRPPMYMTIATLPGHTVRIPSMSFFILSCLHILSELLTFPPYILTPFPDALGSFECGGNRSWNVGMGNMKKRGDSVKSPGPPPSFSTCPSTQKHPHISWNPNGTPARGGDLWSGGGKFLAS